MVFVRSIPGQQQTRSFSCIPCYLPADAAISTSKHMHTLPQRKEELVFTELTF